MATTKKAENEIKQEEVLLDLSTRVGRSTIAVIDTVVSRGAFKGEELSTIGQLRDQATQLIQLVEMIESEKAQEA